MIYVIPPDSLKSAYPRDQPWDNHHDLTCCRPFALPFAETKQRYAEYMLNMDHGSRARRRVVASAMYIARISPMFRSPSDHVLLSATPCYHLQNVLRIPMKPRKRLMAITIRSRSSWPYRPRRSATNRPAALERAWWERHGGMGHLLGAGCQADWWRDTTDKVLLWKYY